VPKACLKNCLTQFVSKLHSTSRTHNMPLDFWNQNVVEGILAKLSTHHHDLPSHQEKTFDICCMSRKLFKNTCRLQTELSATMMTWNDAIKQMLQIWWLGGKSHLKRGVVHLEEEFWKNWQPNMNHFIPKHIDGISETCQSNISIRFVIMIVISADVQCCQGSFKLHVNQNQSIHLLFPLALFGCICKCAPLAGCLDDVDPRHLLNSNLFWGHEALHRVGTTYNFPDPMLSMLRRLIREQLWVPLDSVVVRCWHDALPS